MVALATPGSAQLCPGDSKDNTAITNVNQYGQVQAWARTRLNHGPNHINCAGIVGTKAELWDVTFTGCGTGTLYNPQATDTVSNAYHEKIAQRWCTVFSCSLYHTRSRHYFNGNQIETKEGNLGEGGCGGPGCTPCSPGYVEGFCQIQQQDACGCCPDPSPLVVDRSGNGLEFSSAVDGALFDINGHRSMFWLGWPTSADDAWLALDRNGNGRIDNGSELFGNTRVLKSGVNARHGYEVLAELDDNHDGVINAQDSAFQKLVLWGDGDRDGVSQPRELVSLAAVGIQSLSLDFDDSRRHDAWGNQFRYIATDGSTTDVFPIWRLPDSKLEDPE
jgi:hypothetical protein